MISELIKCDCRDLYMKRVGSLVLRKFLYINLVGLFVLGLGSAAPGKVQADTKYASKERSTIARAHMSRARALLVEALAEFEESRKYARPDLLIDSEDWRLRVVSLTEQLNRVVDPRPRVTREGAVFRAPPRLVKRQVERLPDLSDGAKTRSDYGEKQRLKERQEARARLYKEDDEKEINIARNESAVISSEDSNTKKVLEELPEDLVLPEEPQFKGSKENIQKPSVFTEELLPSASSDEVDEVITGDADLGTLKSTDSEVVKDLDELDEPENDLIKDSNEKRDAVVSDSLKNAEERASFNSLPEVISDEEVGEISPKVVEKQLTEDEELTKRLEESISRRLKDRAGE